MPDRPDLDHMDRYPLRQRWHPEREHRGYSCTGDLDAFGDESLYRPSRLGEAAVEPSCVLVGARAPLCLGYTAGPEGLPQGAQVTFVMRGQSPLGRPWGDFALDGPQACGLAALRFGFALRDGPLLPGQRVTLSCPPFAWTPLAGRREFKVVIRRDKNGSEQRLPEPLAIEVLPGPPNRLEATLPCTHRPGDALSALVTLRDRYDNRASWEGMVDLWDGRKSHSLAVTGGRGTCTLSALSESAPARVHASAGALDLDAASNPSLPTSGLQFYVGDLHCHDYLSEAEGAPDEVMRWAWEERRLDFCSLVPQAHGWLDNETWTLAKHTAERFLREGQFVTLLGFEWQHSGYGDKVVHYLGGDQPYLPPDDERYDAPRKLYAALRASDALVIGHHPGYPVGQWVPGTDFGAVEDDVERLVELWSMHGSSEGTDPADRPLVGADDRGGVMAALRQGLRLGFVGGSDTHSGRPGGSAKEPRPYWGGLAGVWAEGLTRRDLFGALRARRTVALTGARMVVRFTVNGAPMGAEIPACERVRIRVDAWTPGRIAQVQVLKNTRLVQTPDRSRKTCQVLDRECHLELEDAPGGPAFYHCRVVQDDGHLAVCSPVWVG